MRCNGYWQSSLTFAIGRQDMRRWVKEFLSMLMRLKTEINLRKNIIRFNKNDNRYYAEEAKAVKKWIAHVCD